MISTGTIVGNRYRVTRTLGGGGMKQVYLAEDQRLANRPCALAEMIDSFTDPKERQTAAAAFQREAETLAQLEHDNIVRVYDRITEANRHYLVMEYVQGETLEQKLEASPDKKLDEQTVIGAAIQILDALEYLHGQNPPVVYRDLKPANVMIRTNGRVKLIDFGIARLFIPKKTATMVGTQGYASPEQYEGKAEPRSDLYALGVTMFHLLTGWDPALHPPFMFPQIQTLRADISPALAALIGEALILDANRRIGNAGEFRRRLENLKTPSAGLNAGAFAPPPRTVTGTSKSGQTATPVAPILLPEAATVRSLESSNCPSCGKSIPADAMFCPYCSADLSSISEPAPLPRRSRQSLWLVGLIAVIVAVGFAATYVYQRPELQAQLGIKPLVDQLPWKRAERIAAAREHPLKLTQLTLALSTRTGEATAPAATSFKDTEIASTKYLKWSATFDSALAGLASGSEKVEARFYDPSGNVIASSDAERVVGESDKTVDFSGVALMPEGAESKLGQYKVELYFGDQILGQQQFAVEEDLAAKSKAEAVAKAAAQKQLRQAQEEQRKAQAMAAARLRTQPAAHEHPTAGKTFRDCADCPEMIVVPSGSFTMGSPSSEAGHFDDESPQHQVTIGYSFAVGKYPVTRDEYARFASETGANSEWQNPGFAQTGRDPVVNVNWDDAKAYVAWLTQKTGKRYRLLSEAEYEYADRARTTTAYWWGDSDADLCTYANGDPCHKKGTVPVGSYPPNAFGLYDMAGNAWEWTEDCWNDSYAGAPDDGTAWTAGACGQRVLRGGSWNVSARDLRSASRLGDSTGYRRSDDGFRVARTL
jgi:formylglycine-generating enzyme required for sulfatase activity/serine/threonine protein kinase